MSQAGDVCSAGTSNLDELRTGSYASFFYENRKNLFDLIISYFQDGISKDAFCFCVSSDELLTTEVKSRLTENAPELNDYLASGQIAITSYDKAIGKNKPVSREKIKDLWLRLEQKRQDMGKKEIRLVYNTSWLERDGWREFILSQSSIHTPCREFSAIITYDICWYNSAEIFSAALDSTESVIYYEDKWRIAALPSAARPVDNPLFCEKYADLIASPGNINDKVRQLVHEYEALKLHTPLDKLNKGDVETLRDKKDVYKFNMENGPKQNRVNALPVISWKSRLKERLTPCFNFGRGNNMIKGMLFWPGYKFEQGRPADPTSIKTRRTSEEVITLLKQAKSERIELSVTGHLRGVDGCGSSLDLPEFQKSLTEGGARALSSFPSTPTIASCFSVKITFELADNVNIVEYIAPDYGISWENPYRVKNEIVLTPEGRTPNGQKDAPAFIFLNLFGLKGARIICERISPMALAGGMESSNVFNIALIAAASMLSGADLSYADIFSLAVKLENDEFGGLTGGQGHLCCVAGGAYRHIWLSGIKDVKGELTYPYGAFSISLLPKKNLPLIEKHMILAQAGKEYESGKAKISRTASLINDMWTDLLRDRDEKAMPLYKEMPGLAENYTRALNELDFNLVTSSIMKYVEIRDKLCVRWINLALDAHQGKPSPLYAAKYCDKVFGKMNPGYHNYEVVRNMYQEHGEGLRKISLYTLNPISELIRKAKEENIAIMPLGAGGPGANLIVVSAKDTGEIGNFLNSHGLNEITEKRAQDVIKGTGILKGYIPFRTGKTSIRLKGFDKLGLRLPKWPLKVSLDAQNMNFPKPRVT